MDTVSLCLSGLFFGFVWLLNMWIVLRQKETHVETIDLTEAHETFWQTLNTTFGAMAYGGFSKYQQPIDEKRKNDDDEVFDEKRKRLEEDEDDAVEWFIGDDGELIERKAKR